MRANKGQRRPTKGKTQVNEGPQRPTTANEGQRRPMQAHTFGPYVCFFFAFCSKLTILYKFYLAAGTAGAGQCRPTKANAGPQRQKGAQTTRLASFGPLYVFFQMYNLFVIFLLLAVVLVHVFSLTSRGLSLSRAWASPGPSTRARLTII